MKFKIDVIRVRENRIEINGWVVGRNADSEVRYLVRDEKGAEVNTKYVPTRRDDVSMIYFKKVIDKDFGFDVTFDYQRGNTYYLCIICDNQMKRIKFNEESIAKRSSVAAKRREKIRDLCNFETLKVVWDNLTSHGLKAVYIKSKNKIKGLDNDYEYSEWYDKTKPTEDDFEKQRQKEWGDNPVKFSVVIPVFETPDNFLKELLESLLNQTYKCFEICIADGSRKGKDKRALLSEYAAKDERVKFKILGDNLGISGNTNAALDMATGDYVVLCDHDDVVPLDALFECAAAIEKDTAIDCIYSDEDKLDVDGGGVFDPHFKPDFNIDLLCSVNYICHLFVFKKELLDKCGNFNHGYDGAQDYDFIFRITEQANKIHHIPKILYHWRCHMNSTASNPEAKLYAFDAGERAIKAHYKRVHPELEIEKIEKGADYGLYHTYFRINGEPLVSVLIPNKDHTEDLDTAMRSLMAGSYKNLEFIVIENNSVLDKTWEYYEKIQKEFSNVKVVKYEEKGFNFSKINNFGVGFAKGEYLLCMNNDVELINYDSIREMLGYIQRDEVGVVGCKLLYEDDSIQHAGVVIGFSGIAGHTFIGLYDYQKSYFHRANTPQDYSAVTAACLMIKKSVFDEIGGYSEDLAVAFNDIDLCLKVRRAGKLVVYNPYASWHHYESKSRGLEDTPDKVERFNREIAAFMKKWPEILEKGDPYYNPNLTLRKSNFALRDLMHEKIGEPYHIDGIEKYL